MERAAPGRSASIIDIGGGESVSSMTSWLADTRASVFLIFRRNCRRYEQRAAGSASEHVRWLVTDITKAKLESCAYDV